MRCLRPVPMESEKGFLGVIHEGEIPALSGSCPHRLGSGERADLDATSLEDCDHAAVQPGIELDLDAFALESDRSRRGRQDQGSEQGGRGAPGSLRAQKYSRTPHWISRIVPARPVIVPPESLSMNGSGWAKFARLATLKTSMRNSSERSLPRPKRFAR